MVGIENNEDIIQFAERNVNQDIYFKNKNCTPAFLKRNPNSFSEFGSFDAIHLGGALTEIPQIVIYIYILKIRS